MLNSKYVDKGIKKFAENEAKELEQQKVVEEKKKAAKETVTKQWKADLQEYTEFALPT